jgi:hypothetical protein
LGKCGPHRTADRWIDAQSVDIEVNDWSRETVELKTVRVDDQLAKPICVC